jgi:hypothetical protein
MALILVASSTMIAASLMVWGGVWLLTRTKRLRRAGFVFATALALDGIIFAVGVRAPMVTSLLLLPLSASLGTLLGWWIRERGTLVVALVVAAASDLVSTLAPVGFTRQVVEDAARGGRLLTYMSVSVPLDGDILHVVGFADLVLLAIVILALRNLGVGWLPAFGVPFAGFVMALIAGLMYGGIPGLPFLALSTLLYLHFQLD